jgi:hypothetical protein
MLVTKIQLNLPQLYLLHQARALQDAHASMQAAGLQSPIPGLTHQALTVQIVACVGQAVEEIQPVETFAWDKGTYQVSRRRTPLATRFRKLPFMHLPEYNPYIYPFRRQW